MDLQLRMAVEGSLEKFMEKRAKGVASAVTRAVRSVTFGLQRELRRQVNKAKFKNQGLEKLVSAKVMPQRGYQPDAEGVVYSNAKVKRNGEEVDLLEVFDKGATITAKGGKWLAIPTLDAASKRSNPNGGMTKFRPGQLQKLRERASRAFQSGADYKIARKSTRDAYKLFSNIKSTGQTELKFIPTKKPGVAMLAYVNPYNGVQHVAYWLVRQVKLRKRVDIKRAEGKWLPKLEGKINTNLDRFAYRAGDDL